MIKKRNIIILKIAFRLLIILFLILTGFLVYGAFEEPLTSMAKGAILFYWGLALWILSMLWKIS